MIFRILFFVLALFPATPAFSGSTIFLKSGMRLDVEKVWRENGEVKYEMYGATYSYPESDVDRIEDRGSTTGKSPKTTRREVVQYNEIKRSPVASNAPRPTWVDPDNTRIYYFQYTACYSDVPLRKRPSADSFKIGFIPKGQTVRVSEQKGYWVKCVWHDDLDNWYVGWASMHTMCHD